jgi:hypothetical protein
MWCLVKSHWYRLLKDKVVYPPPKEVKFMVTQNAISSHQQGEVYHILVSDLKVLKRCDFDTIYFYLIAIFLY